MVLYALFYVFLVLFIFFDSFKQESNKLELNGKEERKLSNGGDRLTRDGYSRPSTIVAARHCQILPDNDLVPSSFLKMMSSCPILHLAASALFWFVICDPVLLALLPLFCLLLYCSCSSTGHQISQESAALVFFYSLALYYIPYKHVGPGIYRTTINRLTRVD